MQNRRDWLKKALALGAGAPITLSLSQQLMAAPVSEIEGSRWGKSPAAPVKIRLNANENPYGPSEKAKLAIQQSLTEGNRYAIGAQDELKAILAKSEAHVA